jgi:hypothetical protein
MIFYSFFPIVAQARRMQPMEIVRAHCASIDDRNALSFPRE